MAKLSKYRLLPVNMTCETSSPLLAVLIIIKHPALWLPRRMIMTWPSKISGNKRIVARYIVWIRWTIQRVAAET